ncbi:accessory factor UbiK family protein [Blastomonas sp.]|uniref:accessory factor UbiK family protein n=1 Tax=Blastomonas sp. TaxID=1909299 RepID=UPI002603283C|nr:accessory factor UbiK family protein [Blastomonas sp.]MDM7956863.1 accessory factor UbiK family protein [Blastomonas sp.]
MQNKSEFGGDFAKFINGLAGTVAGMSREAGESARERTREWIAGMDFVSREEFDAVKEMASKAREESETLKARLEALEAKLAGQSAGPAA